MERVKLGENLEFSRIIYGLWRIADDGADTSPAAVQAKIESCLEQGITTFDQADIYGDYGAEEVLGNALRAAPHLRDQMEIVTKCDIVAPIGRWSGAACKYYDTTPAHINASVDLSLKLMGIEQIDLLLIHRPDPLMDAASTGGALDALVASGKVANIGVSNFKPHDWTLLQANMTTALRTNQIEISVLENSAFTNGDLAFAQERGVAPMAWSPLAGGALFAPEHGKLYKTLADMGAEAGVDASAVAVAWLLAHPARIMPILGTNNMDRIAALSDALKVGMSRVDWFRIYEAANGCEVP